MHISISSKREARRETLAISVHRITCTYSLASHAGVRLIWKPSRLFQNPLADTKHAVYLGGSVAAWQIVKVLLIIQIPHSLFSYHKKCKREVAQCEKQSGKAK